MNDEQIVRWKEGMDQYQREQQRKQEVQTLLIEWELNEFMDKMEAFGYGDHSLWHTISEEVLVQNIGMRREHIIQWRRGLRRYRLLSDWDLSEFVTKIKINTFGDVVDWCQIPEDHLRGEPLNMNDEQISKWNEGIQRLRKRTENIRNVMGSWGLTEYAENVISSSL